MKPDLDERGRRHWAACEALELGHGGINAVAKATGLGERTVRRSCKEIHQGTEIPFGIGDSKITKIPLLAPPSWLCTSYKYFFVRVRVAIIGRHYPPLMYLVETYSIE